MRSVMRVMLAPVLVAACASPREKDCRELMPRVDAAHEKPSVESASNLRAFEAHDPALRDPVAAYASAIERQASSAKAIEQLVAALELRPGAGPKFSLDLFEPSRPHAERLLARCMPTASAPPDCAALARALEACISPKTDDTTAEEQLLSCASGFAAVESEDAATNASIQALAGTMRDLEPFARNVGAPAKKVILVAKELAPRINEGTKARADANRAEMEIRSLCQPGTRAGTRGSS